MPGTLGSGMQAHKFDAIHTNAAENRRFCRKTNAQLKIYMTQINDTVKKKSLKIYLIFQK